jgi:hypothetical protein
LKDDRFKAVTGFSIFLPTRWSRSTSVPADLTTTNLTRSTILEPQPNKRGVSQTAKDPSTTIFDLLPVVWFLIPCIPDLGHFRRVYSSVFRVPSIYEEKFTNRLSVRTSAYPVLHHFANHAHTHFLTVFFSILFESRTVPCFSLTRISIFFFPVEDSNACGLSVRIARLTIESFPQTSAIES